MIAESDLFTILKRAPWKTLVRQYVVARLEETDPEVRQQLIINGLRVIRANLGSGLYEAKVVFEYAESILSGGKLKFDMTRVDRNYVAKKVAEEIAL